MVAKPYDLDQSHGIFTQVGYVHDRLTTMPCMHHSSRHISEPHAYVVLHLEYFVIVECVVCSFGFSETFCFACSSWFSEMIAYVSAMFDFIDFIGE